MKVFFVIGSVKSGGQNIAKEDLKDEVGQKS